MFDLGKKRLVENLAELGCGYFFVLLLLPDEAHDTFGITNVIGHETDGHGLQGQKTTEYISAELVPSEAPDGACAAGGGFEKGEHRILACF